MYNQIAANKRRTWLLIIIFVLLIAGLGYLASVITNYGPSLFIAAIGLSLIMATTSYFAGDKMALAASGAKAISREENPYVYRLVENLAITAGLPQPKVYLINDPSINAFATGRDPRHASVAITTGAIEKLENEELEGVIAHELSHVKNYDIRLMMVVVVLVGIVALLADLFWRTSLFGGNRRDDNNRGNAVLLIIGVVLIVLSPIIAQLIQLAVSRRREYLADADAALLTRYPEGLASALEKISQQTQDLKRASTATAHLYIANPFSRSQKALSRLFSTHPPITDRISKLRSMT